MPYVEEALSGFTFGCDPELFVMDADGRFVSAEGLIPGTKAEPYPVPCGAVQVDGMAAEFNIDPVETFEEFDHNIETVLKHLKKMLPPGFTLAAVPSVTFDQDVWSSTPEKAKILGCDPDFNAWTGKVNLPPMDSKVVRTRCAGGHLHMGWTEGKGMDDLEHILHCRDLVKQLDWYLGAWSIRKDADNVRRALYGKAGACRYKPYGVEYRVLSNFWVEKSAQRLAVWNRVQKAIHDMRRSYLPDKVNSDVNDWVIKSINESRRNPTLEKYYAYPVTRLEY